MSGAEKRRITVALAGNPNVGKSTLFNALTGLRQHTGNWPGKTVGLAMGGLDQDGFHFDFVDLPGTYSLSGKSEDERIAAEYIASGCADCTVVVCDGCSLERNLILALQILKQRGKVIVCVNLMDEATRMGIRVDREKLSQLLHVPVVLTSAEDAGSRKALLRQIVETVDEEITPRPDPEATILHAQEIAAHCVSVTPVRRIKRQRKLDELLISRRLGILVMLLLLMAIIWLTVWGANYPSACLERLFDSGYALLKRWFSALPWWVSGAVVDGVYMTSARVFSVMLPPMLIFFPLFTILEDVGYLPRMAFLLDHGMARCGGCGKQALTLCMGLGCNAVGVTGCRIIDSPRERLLAILTNAMVPCNGRFPALILLGSLFFPGIGGAFLVALCVVLGIAGAMAASGVLSKTVLRHQPSTFIMEIPPFRKPRIGQILIRSLLDRTLYIAGRTLKVAAPAGLVLWLLTNSGAAGAAAVFLNPAGKLMGLDGIILLAFLLSLPANELLIPVILMVITGTGSLHDAAQLSGSVLLTAGWTWKTAICTMVFTLFHWPCATTLMTIYKETGSWKKTGAAFLLPTGMGIAACMFLNFIFRYFGG